MTNIQPNTSLPSQDTTVLTEINAKHPLFMLGCNAVCVWLLFIVNTLPVAHAAGLTLNQQSQVQALTSDWQWPTERKVIHSHPLGHQTISIEKKEQKSLGDTRWATAYQYSYINNESRLLTVDLEEQKVTSVLPIPNIHLPLNAVEIDFSIQILKENENVIAGLTQEYLKRPNALALNGFFLDLDGLEILFDQSGTVFNMEPIVNLNAMIVQALSPR